MGPRGPAVGSGQGASVQMLEGWRSGPLTR
jgi:hypothetical protein